MTSTPTPSDSMDDDALADAMEGKAPSKPVEAVRRSIALEDAELDALTFAGATVSVQVRSYANLVDGGADVNLAVFHPKGAPRSSENGRPYELAELDVIKLRDLLDEATRRGLLP